jgi:transglutaminase-like putative cysteine protease
MRRRFVVAAAVTVLALFLPTESAVGEWPTAPEAEARQARTFDFFYEFEVTDVPSDARRLAVYAPIPRSTADQKVYELAVTSDLPFQIKRETEHDNSYFAAEATAGDLPRTVRVALRFRVRRERHRAWEGPTPGARQLTGAAVGADPSASLYLRADTLVPIDGPIAREARSVVQADMSGREKARALYEHSVATLRYDKSGTGWGRGDALFACEFRRGNCTDIHSLYIGMARASGVPARFAIGFPLPPDRREGAIAGYHCWMEFYDEERGWVPADASDAIKHPELKEFLFGGLDADRVLFTVGRDLRLAPDVEPLNYFIYPHVLVDGRLHTKLTQTFRFADVE